MATEIRYEDAQAHMEEQMRRAAVWRMQRQAIDARRAKRRNAGLQQGWLARVGKAFRSAGKTAAIDSEIAQNN